MKIDKIPFIHKLLVRLRAFSIWQKLGFMPWSKPRAKSRKGDFYKGAFNSIPFLNDDAKRTFAHLLLRPGYMIRDYIKGEHERYLAPLTSLIIFYAFFALVSSIVNPDFSAYRPGEMPSSRQIRDSLLVQYNRTADHPDSLEVDRRTQKAAIKVLNISDFVELLSLDKHPERVDSPAKASLAALEGALRSQGVYLFLGEFLLLWCAMCFALRKKGMGRSACAATTAYVLCQFCFFMFFSLFFAAEDKGEIGIGLMAVLLTVDYAQLFGVRWKKGLGLAIKTGWYCLLVFLALIVLVVGLAVLYLLINPAG